ncbi:uncharacterized protein Bfra_003735 [Botrytis fragariae]|uniref:Uncharacterized protein n=1 Tax=Botrytis fragariae TaxID=1964551 RepID=A0A8H6EK69_9HELO|nr:uncharacterized protein Bfra_003735 [Botrytis fragariae]KAF5875282.1 hypothetical protein Bfra_003735 [Botrytis fragariae]
MALTDGESDNESVHPPDSPKLSAAASESPQGLVEDMAAYDFDVRHTCPVEGESLNTSWLNHIFIDELFLNTDYPEFKFNVDKALERGLISSLSVASHITTIFGQQEGYQLGRVLEYQTVTSSTALRWLLIAYGSHSTRKYFVDSCMDVAKEVDGLMKTEPGRSVYMQGEQILAQQNAAKEWLEKVKKCAGVLNYWLRVAEEQLKFDQRWGIAKKWVLHGDGWGHLEQIWRTGVIEKLTMNLRKAKSSIAIKLMEAGQNPDYSLQYVNLLRDAGVADGGEPERLVFWPQTGKLEWVYPTQEPRISKVVAEQIRMSAGLFLNDISRQRQIAAVPEIAPYVKPNSLPVEQDTLDQHPAPRILINGRSDLQDVTSQGLPDRYTTTDSEIASQTRIGIPLVEQETAQQTLPGLPNNGRTHENITPRVKTNMFATDWEDTPVRPGKSTTWYWGREPRPIGHGSVSQELEDSRFWYSARKSSDTPNAIEAGVTVPLSSLPRAKAEENESASWVGGLGRDSNTLPGTKGDITKKEDTKDINSGCITSKNRPYVHIDLADLGERLAVLDAAELRAVEERNQQDNRSLAQQTQLDLPRRHTQLREELQNSAKIKKTLLDKLDSDTPIGSKMDAVGIFLDAIEEETEKVQGWTEDLREAEAELDRGYDGDWEESQSEETQNDKQAILRTSAEYSSSSPSSKGKKHTQMIEGSSTRSLVKGDSIENEKQEAKESVHKEIEGTDASDVMEPAIAQTVGRLSLGDLNDGRVAGSDTRGYDGVGPSSSVEEKTTKAGYTAEEHNILSPSAGN